MDINQHHQLYDRPVRRKGLCPCDPRRLICSTSDECSCYPINPGKMNAATNLALVVSSVVIFMVVSPYLLKWMLLFLIAWGWL